MIEPIEFDEELLESVRKEFFNCSKLFVAIHKGVDDELKKRLANLKKYGNAGKVVQLETADLWDALNTCYYRYHKDVFADFEVSCTRCYNSQLKLLNANGGVSLLGFKAVDFPNLSIPFSNPLGAIGYFRVIKLIAIAIECHCSTNLTNLEREILDKANGYLSVDVENWLEKAVNDIVATFNGTTDFKALFIQLLQSSRPTLNRPINGNLYDKILKTLVPHADLAYSLFSRAKRYKGVSIRDVKGIKLQFQCGELPAKFELAKCLKGYAACDKEGCPGVYIGFRGSASLANFVTDFHQLLFGPDISYFLAVGIVAKVYEDLKGSECNIHVVGHSLGGGLAQYSAAAVDDKSVDAVCYNSAGLAEKALDTLNNRQNLTAYKVLHMYVCPDFVFLCGNQLGSAYKYSIITDPFSAHCMKNIRSVSGSYDYLKLIYCL